MFYWLIIFRILRFDFISFWLPHIFYLFLIVIKGVVSVVLINDIFITLDLVLSLNLSVIFFEIHSILVLIYRYILFFIVLCNYFVLYHLNVIIVVVFAILTQKFFFFWIILAILQLVGLMNALFFGELSFKHFWIKKISFVFKQIENNIFAVSSTNIVWKIPIFSVLSFTIRAKTKRFFFYLFLFSPCKKKSLARQFGYRMNEAYSVIYVVAV